MPLMIGFLVLTLGVFVGAVVLSFQVLHGDTAPSESNSPPLEIVGSEQTVFDSERAVMFPFLARHT